MTNIKRDRQNAKRKVRRFEKISTLYYHQITNQTLSFKTRKRYITAKKSMEVYTYYAYEYFRFLNLKQKSKSP